jgi:isopropylmalate/homocitrate/citramalate synthase
MKHKLNKSSEEVLDAIKESVSYAKKFTDDVEWSCEMEPEQIWITCVELLSLQLNQVQRP